MTGPRIVDAHHHLWDPTAIPYRLLDRTGPLAPLARPVLSREFDAVAHANGIADAIVVEAASAGADPQRETEWLLGQISASAVSRRIVAYAPVEDPAIDVWLDRLLRDPRIVGIRRTFEAVPDGFILCEAVIDGIRKVGAHGLPFDLVLFADRMGEAVELVRRLPGVRFVLDHMGKPPIAATPSARWQDDIAALASLPNVVVKVSGLLPHRPTPDWRELVRPNVAHAAAMFGWRRLMFASDWPICELGASYSEWLQFTVSAAAGADDNARSSFLSLTCDATYRRLPLSD